MISTNYKMEAPTIQSGGSENISSANYNIFIGVGEPIVGNASNYWFGFFSQYDTEKPIVNLEYPENYAISSILEIDFRYNVSDQLDIEKCRLWVNNIVENASASITRDIKQYFNNTIVAEGLGQIWKVECTDFAGNIGNSSELFFDVIIPLSLGTGGGGINPITGLSDVPVGKRCLDEEELIEGICLKRGEVIVKEADRTRGLIFLVLLVLFIYIIRMPKKIKEELKKEEKKKSKKKR